MPGLDLGYKGGEDWSWGGWNFKNLPPTIFDEAETTSRGYMDEMIERQEGLYDPLIKMGDEQLQALREGVESGVFSMDESLFRDYQNFVVPQYEPGGMFQYEPRERIVTPERFQSQGQMPGPISAPQPYSYQGQVPNFRPLTQQDFGTWRGQQYTGRDVMTDHAPYQGQAAPQTRQISSQFQTPGYQQGQPQPGFYRAPDASEGRYYDPSQQYQGRDFNIEDDPVYQRRLEQGGKAIEGSAAARGMQLSGKTLKELQEFGQNLAAEEGQQAWERWRAEDQTGYQRFQDQQSSAQEAMRYRNEDEYRRYLDQVGIRGAEADQAVQQWNIDRSFGAEQNKETWLREQASKQFGRSLNDDEFQRWLSTDGQQFAQYANQRDWTTGQSNLAADTDWNRYTYGQGFGRDVYESDRGFRQAANIQNLGAGLDLYSTDVANQLAIGGQNWSQQLGAGQFNLDRYNKAFQNQLAGWGAQQQADLDWRNVYDRGYEADRAFGYGAMRDYEADRWNQYQYGTNLGAALNEIGYGRLTDAYGRQQQNLLNQYNMLSGLGGIGVGVRDPLSSAYGDYYGNLTDLEISRANALMAERMQPDPGLLDMLGL